MTFYLLSEGLTCVGMCSGVYESLKVLARADKGLDAAAALSPVLEFWLVLGAMAVFEEYLELFVAWIPFYYFFKCALLGLVLVPDAKIPHVLFHAVIDPGVEHLQHLTQTHVAPLAETLLARHGQWLHRRLVTEGLELLDEHELEAHEQQLRDRLHDVREALANRRRRRQQQQQHLPAPKGP